MNDSAAALAASRRLGSISVEHLLPETSIARTMVVWPVGTLTMATGRPNAITRLASARRNRANGRWRRRRDGGGSAARTQARLGERTAKSRRRRSIQIYTATIRGINPSRRRNPGQSKAIDYLPCALKARLTTRRAGIPMPALDAWGCVNHGWGCVNHRALRQSLTDSPIRSRQAAEPQERQCTADQQDENAGARKNRSDFHLVRFDNQLQVKIFVDLA